MHTFAQKPNATQQAASARSTTFQAKPALNTSGDIYEQEADRISEQVTRMPEPHLQRACPCDAGCPTCQPEQPHREHERLQTKRVQASATGELATPPTVQEVLAAPGQPLDPALRGFMEPRFGYDFSKVRVHSDSAADQSARDVSAHAYTVGHHIVFAAKRFAAGTLDGRRLIAHELAHVVQQSGGEGNPTPILQRQPAPPTTPQKKKDSPKKTRAAPAHEPLSELKRVGFGAWEMTLEGYTDAAVVGRLIWPSGLPSGVRIVSLAVKEKPVKAGVFRLTGVMYDDLDKMAASYAKWFSDNGLRLDMRGHPLRTIRLWFKAFIPGYSLRVPGYDCFRGDNRSYSADPKASARLTSEVLLTNLHTATPAMAETHWCGLTRQVDCDSDALIDSATADTAGMRFYNFRYPGAVVWDWSEPQPPAAHPPEITVGPSEPVSLDYIGAAADPIPLIAPLVDIWAHIALDLQSGVLTVSGKVDDYPAFEAYVTVNEKHGPFNIFAIDAGTPFSTIGGANRSFSKTISLGSYAAMG